MNETLLLSQGTFISTCKQIKNFNQAAKNGLTSAKSLPRRRIRRRRRQSNYLKKSEIDLSVQIANSAKQLQQKIDPLKENTAQVYWSKLE